MIGRSSDDQELIERLQAEYRRPPTVAVRQRHLERLRDAGRASTEVRAGRSPYQLTLAAAAVVLILVVSLAQISGGSDRSGQSLAPAADSVSPTSALAVTLPPTSADERPTSTTEPEVEPGPVAGPPTTALSATSVVAKPRCGGEEVTIDGTAGDDVLRGTEGRDVILGRGGNDRIFGNGGDDLICAGPGDDLVRAGDGNDAVWGGGGNDVLHGDKLDDRLFGQQGDDIIWGGGGADRLSGAAGADTLDGQWGDDTYSGGGQEGDRCADTTASVATVVDCD